MNESGARQADAPIPEGWTRSDFPDEFIVRNGPLAVRLDPKDGLLVGLRVERRHCNPFDICHGGMLMTFADMMVPMAAHHHPQIGRKFLPTISLATDFLAPAPLGAWLTGRTTILRVTRNLVFAQGLIYADDGLVCRLNGVYKIAGALPEHLARATHAG